MHIIDTWQKNASKLIAVAAGRDHAELVVQNCRLVNVIQEKYWMVGR